MKEQIKEIKALKILNSRSEETIEIILRSNNFESSFSVPQGKSTGKHEAVFLQADEAIEKVRSSIFPKIRGEEINFHKIDKILIEADNTPQKKVLGANTILGISVALAKLQAKIEGKQIFEFLSLFLPFLQLIPL